MKWKRRRREYMLTYFIQTSEDYFSDAILFPGLFYMLHKKKEAHFFQQINITIEHYSGKGKEIYYL